MHPDRARWGRFGIYLNDDDILSKDRDRRIHNAHTYIEIRVVVLVKFFDPAIG